MKLERVRNYYLYFMLYAIIGWIYEVVLEVFIYKWGFTNRGVLFGPYCPVYGFGALAFIFGLGWLLKNKTWKQKILLIPVIFIGCMTIATVIELIASYLCEWILGSWPWQTYADYKINFQARIALSPSLRFGLGGVIFMYILQPLFEVITDKVPSKILNIVAIIIGSLFLIDIIYKIVTLVI